MSATRTSSDKSAGSGAAQASSTQDATSVAMGGNESAQNMLNAASAPTALLMSLGVELQRLQAEAFAATGKALESAMQQAAQSTQPQDLLKVQFDFIGAAMERAANYNREWFTRVAEAQSQLMGMAPNASSGAGAGAFNMPTFSPAEFLSRGPEAWTQLTKQWMEGMTKGAMPG